MTPSDERADADVEVHAHFDRMTRAYLRSALSDDVIAEHRNGGDAHPSEPLARLLMWMARRRLAQPYAIKQEADGSFRLIAMPGRRGAAPRPLGDQVYSTLAAARHAVFLLHVRDLQE